TDSSNLAGSGSGSITCATFRPFSIGQPIRSYINAIITLNSISAAVDCAGVLTDSVYTLEVQYHLFLPNGFIVTPVRFALSPIRACHSTVTLLIFFHLSCSGFTTLHSMSYMLQIFRAPMPPSEPWLMVFAVIYGLPRSLLFSMSSIGIPKN